MLAARHEQQLRRVAQDMGCAYHRCVIPDENDRQALIEATLAKLGRIDVLVNNAGRACEKPAADEPPERFREVLE
jgi:NADP-dependent 3-hydroxy acid dehydrogenase YdfG